MKTLDAPVTYDEIIKKSRFIARANRAESVEEAMTFLSNVHEADATHNCWAYRLGDTYRFSDDGEPGGTAGRPIYMAIEKQDYDHVMVVVTRYFGGIKLGAGGLARAYGGVTGKCLQLAKPYFVQDRVVFQLQVSFKGTGIVYSFLDDYPKVERLGQEYTAEGILFTLRIVLTDFDTFKQAAMDASSGDFTVNTLKTVRE